MPRVRRLVGAFVHLLMLHLLMVGSGDACVLPAVAGTAHTLSAAADAGGTSDMTTSRHTAPSGAQECDGAGTLPDGRHQQQRQAPACQSMAPCASAAFAATPTTVERPAAPVETGPLGIVMLAPASRTSAPEPPPPRA